ncbi:hypothetical protein C0J52_01949 [Blattella germanica]|nr:hypothetical protein C0J52_01949 [Blattella germanica]
MSAYLYFKANSNDDFTHHLNEVGSKEHKQTELISLACITTTGNLKCQAPKTSTSVQRQTTKHNGSEEGNVATSQQNMAATDICTNINNNV